MLHWEAAVVAKTCHDVVAWHTEHTAMEGAKSALGGRGSHPQKMRVWPVPRKADYAGAHNGKPDKCEMLRSAYSVARRGISQLEEGMRGIVWCAMCKCTRGRLVRKRRGGGGKERWACAKRKARMGHESSVIQRYKILI